MNEIVKFTTNINKTEEIKKVDTQATSNDNNKNENYIDNYTINNNGYKVNAEEGEIVGLETLDRDNNILIITESFSDFEILKNRTFYATLTTGDFTFSEKQKENLLDIIKDFNFENVYLAFHNPNQATFKEHTQRGMEQIKLATFLFNHKLDVNIYSCNIRGTYYLTDDQEIAENNYRDYKPCITIVDTFKSRENLPEEFDLTELITMDVLFNEADNLLHFIAKMHMNFNDFNKNYEIAKKIIEQTRLWLDPSKLYNFLEYLKTMDYVTELEDDGEGGYDEVIVGKYNDHIRLRDIPELEKLINAKISEQFLRQEILNKYYLKYTSTLGFMMYKNNIWNPISFAGIRQLVDKETNGKASAQLLKNTASLIQVACNEENLTFNNNDLIVVENGTLELPSGYLRPSRPLDMATNMLPVTYEEGADCPLFKNFLKDVTGNNANSIKTIQKFLGYVLLNNHKAKVFFNGYGETNSGKSTLVRIIQSVIGIKNISNLHYKDFNRQFHLIQLESSLLNIADDEQNPDFTIIPNQFNNFISGDSMMDSNKQMPVRSFIPLAKEMVFTNKPITAKGGSVPESILTRLVEVEFPMHFVPYTPKRDNEIQIDFGLENRIIQNERPGILNWMLEGARMVENDFHHNRHPFFNQENERRKETIRNNENKILPFIEDYRNEILKELFNNKNKRITTKRIKEFYSEYINLNNYSGQDCLKGREITYKFKREFIKLHPEFESFSAGGENGIKLKNGFINYYKTFEDYLNHLNQIELD